MKTFDHSIYNLYLVTDRACLTQDHTLITAVEQAILGGVTLVQLREKNLASKVFFEQAQQVKQVCRYYQVPLIINDRVDIALAVDADGVHIGQSDLPAEVVRQLIDADKIIGVSARTVLEAQQAEQAGADYIGVGAMFSTQTKADAKSVSVSTLADIRHAVSLPIVAIGGINQTTLPQLLSKLAQQTITIQGIAVVSAILAQPDIKLATEQLKLMLA